MADGDGMTAARAAAPTAAKAVSCREIGADDLPAVAALLTRGFAERDLAFWTGVLAILAAHRAPESRPKFGYMLDAGGEAVGVILLIFAHDPAVVGAVRCSASSWYVEPAYRPMATPMIVRALRFKDVTYTNISASPHTWPILKAQGYRRYVAGQVIGLPWLWPGGEGRCEAFDEARHEARLSPTDAAVLRDHAGMGCTALVVERDGALTPFVFMPLRITRFRAPAMQLAYCHATEDFVRSAGPLGRWLLAHRGAPFVVLDSDAPIRGVCGHLFKGHHPKYCRGPDTPRLNDIAYTESVMFGV